MLLLVDANSVFARGYFAPVDDEYQDSKHFAVYRFGQRLLSFLKDYEPETVVLAWDGSVLIRREWYSKYKVGRKPKPDDYYRQIDYAKGLAFNSGFLNVEIVNREADDVIAAYANSHCTNVLIVTGDTDLLQLVYAEDFLSVQVELLKWNPKIGSHRLRFAAPRDVYDYMGVWPSCVADYKGIVGDSSDNFPGVAGVGKTKVAPWLEECGTLEEVYGNLDDLPGVKKKSGEWSAARQKMLDGREMAFLCRKLAKPLPIESDELPFPLPTPKTQDIHSAIKKFKEAHGGN